MRQSAKLTFRTSEKHFLLKNIAFCALAISQKSTPCQQILPREVTRQRHQILHLNENWHANINIYSQLPGTFFAALSSPLLSATLPYSSLLRSTPLYFALLYSPPLSSPLLCSILFYTLPYFALAVLFFATWKARILEVSQLNLLWQYNHTTYMLHDYVILCHHMSPQRLISRII